MHSNERVPQGEATYPSRSPSKTDLHVVVEKGWSLMLHNMKQERRIDFHPPDEQCQGPKHSPDWTCYIIITSVQDERLVNIADPDEYVATGHGGTKKEAKEQASRNAILEMTPKSQRAEIIQKVQASQVA